MKRAYVVNQADLRMDGNLAMNVKRVLPVSQADFATAVANGQQWNVKQYHVVNTLDNMRGGTLRILKVNAPAPGVQRAFLTSEAVMVTLMGVPPLVLPDAVDAAIPSLIAFGGTEQRNLPLGYTQFGRIHFDGNCYFDTGIVINSLTATVKLIAAFDSQTSSPPCFMWGYMGSNSNLPRWGVGLFSGKWLTSANTTSEYGTADTDKHIFITELYSNNETPSWRSYLDSVILEGASIASSETITGNTLSVYIGARNNRGTASNYVKGNFTYLEITQDGVCLAKIYPCKRDSDNVLGLYNTVTNEFLPNLGTGTLTADIFASPTPDAPIDVVCNNGVIKVSPNLFNASQTVVSSRDDIGPALLTRPSVYNRANCANSSVGQIIPMGNTTSSVALLFTLGDSYMVRAFEPLGGLARYSWATTNENNVIIERGSYSYGTPITPTLDAKYIYIQFGAALSSEQLGSCMLVKGTTNPTEYMPYGKIYVDGTTETIQVIGKNLLDQSARVENFYLDANGSLVGGGAYCYSDLIPVAEGGKYTASLISGRDQSKRVHGYYNGVWQRQINASYISAGNTLNITFTIPSGCNGIRLSYAKSDTDVQIETGETATTYEQYFSGGTATATDLLAIDTEKDVQEVLTGNVTRNIGVVVLDGKESYGASSAYGSAVYIKAVSNIWDADKTKKIMCSHFLGKAPVNSGLQDENTCFFNISGHCYFRTSMTTTTFPAFVAEQYANGTPFIIVYVKSTPTTETVTPQPLQTTQGDNTAEITQASIDGLELQVTYMAGVSLTIEEVQDAQLSPDVEVTIQ